ncbi:MAG TPA: hypothetical protein VJ305_19815, partial [Streptosporangiaceae bacterium]|nr:hypothetical protein [Streptosporangiaceae bacterium]
ILQVSSDDGTGGAGVRSGTVTVSAVDINAGTITVSGANWAAGIAAVQPGDFVFQNGNYNGAFPGLFGWLPPYSQGPNPTRTGLTSALFNGVNRTVDPVRLGGVAYPGQGAPKSESFIQLGMLVHRMGGRPDIMVANPVDYADLERELGSRVQYIQMGGNVLSDAQISFPGIEVATPYGRIKILEDVFCPQGYGFMLETDSWLIPSMQDLIRVAGEGTDGLQWLRAATSDSYQMRVVSRATTYCSAPGHNGVVTW